MCIRDSLLTWLTRSAEHEVRARQVQHRAATAFQRKQQRAFRSDANLLVISGLVQLLAALQQRDVQLLGTLGGRAEDGLGNGVQLVVEWIHQDHARAAEQPRKQPRKGRAKALTGAITLTQSVADPARAEQFRGALDHGGDAFGERHWTCLLYTSLLEEELETA